MQSLFFSYAREDAQFVQIAGRLVRATGLDVFIDVEALIYGSGWRMQVESAIERAERLFLFWSKWAMQSKWVRHEIRIAKQRQKRIVPILLDSSPLPRGLQHVHGIANLGEVLLQCVPPPLVPRADIDLKLRAANEATAQTIPDKPASEPKPSKKDGTGSVRRGQRANVKIIYETDESTQAELPFVVGVLGNFAGSKSPIQLREFDEVVFSDGHLFSRQHVEAVRRALTENAA